MTTPLPMKSSPEELMGALKLQVLTLKRENEDLREKLDYSMSKMSLNSIQTYIQNDGLATGREKTTRKYNSLPNISPVGSVENTDYGGKHKHGSQYLSLPSISKQKQNTKQHQITGNAVPNNRNRISNMTPTKISATPSRSQKHLNHGVGDRPEWTDSSKKNRCISRSSARNSSTRQTLNFEKERLATPFPFSSSPGPTAKLGSFNGGLGVDVENVVRTRHLIRRDVDAIDLEIRRLSLN